MNIQIEQAKQILQEHDTLAALCNITAFLYAENKDLNWLGFYFYKNGELVLGPFQGKVACTHLKIGKGVCGTSIQERKVLNVKNVHEFPGHIACDSASNSELVIPLIKENTIYGVLDIDSSILNRFSNEDEIMFVEIANLIIDKLANQ